MKRVVPWIFFFISAIFWALHFNHILPGNNISWIAWILALATYFLSLERTEEPKFWTKPTTLLISFAVLVYFSTHLWNYSVAPWNNFGLFDDAAWDLIFAKNYVFNHTPYQAVFYDPLCFLYRETLFHYYVFLAFKIFGYNLSVFNGSLILMGFFAILFTALLAQEFFSNLIISILVTLITIFLPVVFLHLHAGYRYVMALPLMMASYYFLYSGFRLSSQRRILLGGLFAGLCLESSITGKQYIMALLITAALWLVMNHKAPLRQKMSLARIFILSFICSILPLVFYVYFTGPAYFSRESSLIHIFVDNFKAQGMKGIAPNIQSFLDLFFSPFSYTRWFEPDFLIIPLGYYPLLAIGLVISFIRKRYEILFISSIILLGSFVAQTNDYRILLATGTWSLAMGFTLNEIYKILTQKNRWYIITLACTLFGTFLLGFGTSFNYLDKLSSDTNRVFYFPHKDVALSRLLQDIIAGVDHPSVEMKQDEFNRNLQPPTDFLICPETANAILRLYSQDFDGKKMLYFCDSFPYNVFDSEKILKINLEAIRSYAPNHKDLQLIWEISEKIEPVLKVFRPYSKYGHSEIFYAKASGIKFRIYSLFIKNENLAAFKTELSAYASSRP